MRSSSPDQLGERATDGQGVAVTERYAVVRVERHEPDVVVQIAPGKTEELAVGIRHQKERWAGIEGEAIRLQPSHASADLGVLLEDLDLEAPGGQPDRRRQAAHPGPDDRHPLVRPGR